MPHLRRLQVTGFMRRIMRGGGGALESLIRGHTKCIGTSLALAEGECQNGGEWRMADDRMAESECWREGKGE